MEKHIKTARLHRALAWLYGLMTLLIGGIFAYSTDEFTLTMTVGVLVLASLSVLHFILSRGARQAKNWSRCGSLVVGILALPGFPLGTVLGAYLIANTWNRWPDAAHADQMTVR